MQETKFALRKKKIGCVFIGLSLFFIFGIVAAVANMILNFSFSTVLGSLAILLVCGGLGYFLVLTSLLNNPPTVTLNADGIEIIGLGMLVRQAAAWAEVEAVEAVYQEIQKQKALTIKLLPPKAPLLIPESAVDDFANFSAVVKAHFLAHQGAAVRAAQGIAMKMEKTDVSPAGKRPTKPSGDVVFDREERIEAPELGATFIYQIYTAPDAASAQAFLAKTPVHDAHVYILVHTPEGITYCRDVQGTYTQ
ncbi:hypothetical protein [Levilinea saccharolytica]|uniref:Uncharacterized protein n=1 Tax=Levilinea saccharolytica TaxID=229921 RepID=A0A0N8GMM8_9CHLR|nr:hypothetical protein [Levilinea saccharolytica]KPL75738.1 hypothetical protein ADN01_18125 [Levilinea saccharolytica]GAP16691.1 hypothetical protein LSAC_00547 [Levilinea saccharolytica]